MDGLTTIFIVGSLLAVSFLLWTYTKRGKRWLKNL